MSSVGCFLSALPGSSSLMEMNHISFEALSFLGFEMSFGQIISRLYDLHFSKWRAVAKTYIGSFSFFPCYIAVQGR